MIEHKVGARAQLKIVVAEGRVTLPDLHRALDEAIKRVPGGCNCGLTGFDLSFVGGDPAFEALHEVLKVPNIQGAAFLRG